MILPVIFVGLLVLNGCLETRGDISQFIGGGPKPYSRDNLIRGVQGITVVDVGDPKVAIVIKDNIEYPCPKKNLTIQESDKCVLKAAPYEARDIKDYCKSVRYAHKDGKLCIPAKSTTMVEIINANLCVANDGTEPLYADEIQYEMICGKLPWDFKYIYWSPHLREGMMHQLGCSPRSQRYCAFRAIVNTPSLSKLTEDKIIISHVPQDESKKGQLGQKLVNISGSFNQEHTHIYNINKTVIGNIQLPESLTETEN